MGSYSVEHVQEAFSRVSHLLPDDVTTVHDYGFWDGRGTLWLTSRYSNVTGFDITLDHASNVSGVDLRIGDVRYPLEDADLIYVGHVLEGGKYKSDMTDRPTIVERLRRRCRYLLLQIHRQEAREYCEFQDALVPDAILHSAYTCSASKWDSVTLLHGYL